MIPISYPIRLLLLPDTKAYPARRQGGLKAACRELPEIIFGRWQVICPRRPVGSVTGSNAFLTVIVPPTLALELWAGYPLLDLNGMLSSNFVVQYSTDLAGSNWMNLLSLSNSPASPYLFLDPAGDGEPARFYRAFMR